MALSAISGAIAGQGQADGDGHRIADNFDTFLQLLTTQLRNQNPLDPLDTHQFTQQLVQFADVEQSIRQNRNLETLIAVSTATTATAAASFIGKNVTVESSRGELKGDQARWMLNVSGSAPQADLTIRDAGGQIVWSERRSLESGRDQFVWNGRMNDGGFAPEGLYSLTVDARDADGQTVSVRTEVEARIDGIDFSGNEPMLLAGGRELPLSELRSVTGP